MYTVSDVAKEAKVTADTVRHYVKKGLLYPLRHEDNGYKLFSKNDITRIQFIRNAKSLGFTLKEISEIFSHSHDGNSPCPQVRDALQRHIVENEIQLKEMIALQERMKLAMSQWNQMPDGIPDGNSVCYLIESIAEETTDE